MISPKSSADKHAARYDFKRSFVRLILPSVLSLAFSLFYFIAVPLSTISSAGTYSLSLRAANIVSIRKHLACALFGATWVNYVYFGIFALIVGVLFAFCAFLPIMRKSSVNFFFSCGIDRKTYFKNRTLSSVILMILTTAITRPKIRTQTVTMSTVAPTELLLTQKQTRALMNGIQTVLRLTQTENTITPI